jgi:ferredoxin-NADP reductase
MHLLDKFLNNITMYRLMVYVLGTLAGLGIAFSFMGRMSSSPTAMVVSLGAILLGAYVTDRGFGKFFRVPTNMESSLITALILFLIIRPPTSVMTALTLLLAGAISSASKFILAWRGKHIFNPAALAAAVLSLTGLQAVTWWVGNASMWPFALILGLAVIRKIRRAPLFLTFVGTAAFVQLASLVDDHVPLMVNMKHALIASPLIFLSTIMLTEPATMPPRRNQQLLFAVLIAVLYVKALSIGPLTIYPEVALLIGNVFAFVVSPKSRVRLTLKEVQKISDRVYNYVFQPDQPLAFLPGQYMEWTLADVPYDSRGNRRTFTIASSPTESEVHLGVKFYEPASTYKAAFFDMQPGAAVYASDIAGNFTIKGKETQKLAFIAGGIGITPFRSMLKYVTDQNLECDITLLYVVSDPHEFAYIQQLREAQKVGLKVIPIVTDPSYQAPSVVSAKLSQDLIARLIPDYAERTFYISGPSSMVDGTKDYLKHLGVQRKQIMTDHFSGY